MTDRYLAGWRACREAIDKLCDERPFFTGFGIRGLVRALPDPAAAEPDARVAEIRARVPAGGPLIEQYYRGDERQAYADLRYLLDRLGGPPMSDHWAQVRDWVRGIALSIPVCDFGSGQAINAMTDALTAAGWRPSQPASVDAAAILEAAADNPPAPTPYLVEQMRAHGRPSPPADDDLLDAARECVRELGPAPKQCDADRFYFARALIAKQDELTAERAAREAAEARAHNGRLAVAEERKLAAAAEAEVAGLREALQTIAAQVNVYLGNGGYEQRPGCHAGYAQHVAAAALAPAAPEEATTQETPMRYKPDIDWLVNRFLSWQLPDSVRSDLCVTQDYPGPRSGTNLLTADEARQMIEYLLAAPEAADGR